MTSRRDIVKGTIAAAAGAGVAGKGLGERRGFAAAASKENTRLVTFKGTGGKIDVETLWRAGDGQWDWAAARPFAADVGARRSQACFLYGYPDDRTALFTFDDTLKPRKLWESAPGAWSVKRSMVATADALGTGTNEIYVLYEHPQLRAALHKFDQSFEPRLLWDTGKPNTWIWIYTRLFSADMEGTGKAGLNALYQNGGKDTQLFVD